MNYYPGFMTGNVWGWFLMIVFWAVVIYLIVMFLRQFSKNGFSNDQSKQSKSALDILKERYARGEIGKAEFDEKKKDIIS